MKMFSDCSGPCETCANNKPGLNCLAGHGDDHYVPCPTCGGSGTVETELYEGLVNCPDCKTNDT